MFNGGGDIKIFSTIKGGGAVKVFNNAKGGGSVICGMR